MSRFLPGAALASLLLIVQPGASGAPPAREQQVAQYLLDELRQMNRVPGLSAAVLTGEGAAWAGTSGWANVETRQPAEPTTRFRLASVSKLFAAALALRLWERDLIDIDREIRLTFEELPETFTGVTLRHLAAHASGMAHYTGLDNLVAARNYATLVETLPIYSARARLFAPGEGYNYSSWGYALMGASIENATGTVFATALSRHVLEPLSLHDTSVEDVSSISGDDSSLYMLPASGSAIPIDPNDQSFAIGATGIRSTALDAVAFAAAYAKGELVSAAVRDESWSPFHLNDGSNAGTDRYDVGFGWRIGRDWDERRVVHHAGVTAGARSVLLVYRETDAAVALLSNASWTSRVETTAELLAAPFIEPTGDQRCPEGSWSYRGTFARATEEQQAGAEGNIVITAADGFCRGIISPRNSVSDWLLENDAGVGHLAMARVASRDDTIVFAFVTPWGLFPLRVRVDGEGNLAARGEVASFTLRLTGTNDAEPAPAL